MSVPTLVGVAHDATHLALSGPYDDLVVPLDAAGAVTLADRLDADPRAVLCAAELDPVVLRRGLGSVAARLVEHAGLAEVVELAGGELPRDVTEQARVVRDLARLVAGEGGWLASRLAPAVRSAGRASYRVDGIGPVALAPELCAGAGLTLAELDDARRAGLVLGVAVSAVRWVYPRAQFVVPDAPGGVTPSHLLPGWTETLARLRALGLTPLEQARWLRRSGTRPGPGLVPDPLLGA